MRLYENHKAFNYAVASILIAQFCIIILHWIIMNLLWIKSGMFLQNLRYLVGSVEHVEEEASLLGRLEHEADLEAAVQLKSLKLNVTGRRGWEGDQALALKRVIKNCLY